MIFFLSLLSLNFFDHPFDRSPSISSPANLRIARLTGLSKVFILGAMFPESERRLV
jgi:hypothetical protein